MVLTIFITILIIFFFEQLEQILHPFEYFFQYQFFFYK